MGFYQQWIVPALIDLSMRNKRLRPYRERVASAAEGRVLDVGIGSGLNLPFYARRAREIFGLDPSPLLLARAQDKVQRTQIPVHLLEGSAERIPLADRSMDTLVMTWTGCSIPEVGTALEDMRRVGRGVRRNGRCGFCWALSTRIMGLTLPSASSRRAWRFAPSRAPLSRSPAQARPPPALASWGRRGIDVGVPGVRRLRRG
jgi:SAM-dependent methyltransferase